MSLADAIAVLEEASQGHVSDRARAARGAKALGALLNSNAVGVVADRAKAIQEAIAKGVLSSDEAGQQLEQLLNDAARQVGSNERVLLHAAAALETLATCGTTGIQEALTFSGLSSPSEFLQLAGTILGLSNAEIAAKQEPISVTVNIGDDQRVSGRHQEPGTVQINIARNQRTCRGDFYE